MSFREKKAWVSFFILLVVGGSYYGNLTVDVFSQGRDWFENFNVGKFYFALHALVVFVIAEVIFYLVIYFLSSKEDRSPKDEREIQFELKATRVAYTSVIILSLAFTFLIIHHGASLGFNFIVGNLIIGTIMIAQLIKFAVQIFYHRRGY